MYLAHEILGTDKPIFKQQEAGYYQLDELICLQENLEDYHHYGFMQIRKYHQTFYVPIYTEKLNQVIEHDFKLLHLDF
jgi:hypothetical protein